MKKKEDTSSSSDLSSSGQIAQAVADLFKDIASGIPLGKSGVICRFLIIFDVLLTLLAIVAILKGTSSLAWGCLIAMVLFTAVLVLLYSGSNDRALAAGQEARVQEILTPK